MYPASAISVFCDHEVHRTVTKKSEKSQAPKKQDVSETIKERSCAQENVPVFEQREQPAAGLAAKSDDEQPQDLSEMVEVPTAELEQLKAEKDEYYDRLLRLTAEFDNYKKRIERESESFRRYAAERVIQEILPVLDNFERALDSAPEAADDGFRKGIEIIYRQLSEALTKAGLSPMEAVGREFDPNLHDALMPVQSDEHEEGTVVEEFQKGYTLFDKVIRHAKVSVSAGKPGEEDLKQAADVAEDRQGNQ